MDARRLCHLGAVSADLILTEMVSNNAVAVVITPIAIGLADALGYDARPFVVAVMVRHPHHLQRRLGIRRIHWFLGQVGIGLQIS